MADSIGDEPVAAGDRGEPDLARLTLTELPTPCHRLDRLGAELGIANLWAKRDDRTTLDVGGNKARKLEYLCADAKAQGCDVLVTGGAAQSNHARMTAAAGRIVGMRAVLVLGGDPPSGAVGNVVLDRLLGAEMRFQGNISPAELQSQIVAVTEELRLEGHRPYSVPLGGSSPIGAAAYAAAVPELVDQVGEPGLVVTAVGTAGTYSGLVAGLGDHARVMGVDVEAIADATTAAGKLADEVAALIGKPPPAGQPDLDRSQVGPGYGVPTDEIHAALELTARTEGLILDPVYSGKAMAALIRAARLQALPTTNLDGAPVVFLCTGGLPALFTPRFQRWFDEMSDL